MGRSCWSRVRAADGPRDCAALSQPRAPRSSAPRAHWKKASTSRSRVRSQHGPRHRAAGRHRAGRGLRCLQLSTIVASAFAETHAAFRPVDVLVNNAALTYFLAIADFPVSKWQSLVLGQRARGVLLQSKPRSRTCCRAEQARLWNISSSAAIGPDAAVQGRRTARPRRHAVRRGEGRARALHAGPRGRGLRRRRLGHVRQPVAGRRDAGVLHHKLVAARTAPTPSRSR